LVEPSQLGDHSIRYENGLCSKASVARMQRSEIRERAASSNVNPGFRRRSIGLLATAEQCMFMGETAPVRPLSAEMATSARTIVSPRCRQQFGSYFASSVWPRARRRSMRRNGALRRVHPRAQRAKRTTASIGHHRTGNLPFSHPTVKTCTPSA